MRVSSPIPHKRARIEIIPLIDIMFFLLASFMMVSLSQTHMKGIRVNLPAAVAPPPSQVKDYVSIKVREGNVVTFDNQIVPDDQVLPRLYELHRANPDIKVSISASLMALHGDVITVLDKVRSVGIMKVSYQIRAAPPQAVPKDEVKEVAGRPGTMSISEARPLAVYAAQTPVYAPVVKLLSPGKDPKKPMRMTAKVGLRRTVVMRIKMGIEMARGENKVRGILPEIRITMDLNVTNVSADGDIRYELKVNKAEVLEDAQVDKEDALVPKAGLA